MIEQSYIWDDVVADVAVADLKIPNEKIVTPPFTKTQNNCVEKKEGRPPPAVLPLTQGAQ